MEEFIERIQQGDNGAMAGLWEQVSRYAYKVASHFYSLAEPEDIKQEAFLAVLEAAKHYDNSFEGGFLPYMGQYISYHLRRYVTQSDTYIPINKRGQVLKIARFRADYYKLNGRTPTDRTICRELKLSRAELRDLYLAEYAQTAKSIHDEIGDDITIEDTIKDPEDRIEESEQEIDRERMAGNLWELVDSIDGGGILRLIYQEGLTLQEVACEQNVTQQTIHAKKKNLLRKIRKAPELMPIKRYHDEYIAGLYNHGNLSFYRQTGMSEPEWITLKKLEKEATDYRFIYRA